jgi:hypothetical protein
MHQVPIKRSMVLRTVIPRRRKKRKLRAPATAIASPAIDTISKRRSSASTSRAACSVCKHQITDDNLVYAEDRAQSPHVGGVAAIQKVYPDTAVDNDHLTPRPVRLPARLPRQRYLPKAASTSCCRRSLIINRSACSTVCFLVACPEAFWASLMRTSSISILVRMGHIPVVCINA